jgi:hypothetical protein
MSPGVLTSPMVDVLYQSRLKDMSNFVEDDWLSPEPVCASLPAQLAQLSAPFFYHRRRRITLLSLNICCSVICHVLVSLLNSIILACSVEYMF